MMQKSLQQMAYLVALLALAVTAGAVLALPEDGVPMQAPAGELPTAGQVPAQIQAQAALPYTNLVSVSTADPVTLDPHAMYDTSSGQVASQAYETLLAHPREEPTAWIPQLATGWEVSADGQVYTFTMRSGVTFHAGGTLEPHDVAYSFWRGLLQDIENGPMWLLLDPLFGVYDIDDLPGDDVARCQAVKDAITFDDSARTVTFRLARSFGPFLEVLGAPVGSVLDEEWMVANGDWGGNCTNWRDWHNPPFGSTILHDTMNGTGPFRFVSWVPDEVQLARFDHYWRQEPAWPGGPSGPPELELLVFKTVVDWPTRRDMLLNGQADTVAVSGAAELEPYLWGVYDGYTDTLPTLVDPDNGMLRLFTNLPRMSQTALLLNYDINPEGNPFIGDGTLGQHGIPIDFFADIHVRKGLNYAMDWTRVISDAYGGSAFRSLGPIPRGMMGYDPAQPTYEFSPTLATAELQQAFGGQLWTEGFSMTIAYNEGVASRQRMAEVLEENVELLNPAFHIQVISLSWSDVLAHCSSRRLPVYISGWLQDYHHPHNWVQPYLDSGGSHANFQRFPPDMAAVLDAKVDACIVVSDPAEAETCYRELQDMSYQYAAAMWGIQAVTQHWERTEVRGYYYNPTSMAAPYYALSKGDPPSGGTVSAASGSTVEPAFSSGATMTVEVPAGAVSEDSQIVFTPDVVVEEGHPGELRLGGVTFELLVCPGGECVDGYAFAEPVTLTLRYLDDEVRGLIESELYLYTWDGDAWTDIVADCGWPPTAYGRYPDENLLVVPVCHFSRFGLVGETFDIYLPLVLRN